MKAIRTAITTAIISLAANAALADINIGISLPGTGEAPAAPVFIDGEKRMTLRGDAIARDFQGVVEDYIEQRFGQAGAAANRQ